MQNISDDVRNDMKNHEKWVQTEIDNIRNIYLHDNNRPVKTKMLL